MVAGGRPATTDGRGRHGRGGPRAERAANEAAPGGAADRPGPDRLPEVGRSGRPAGYNIHMGPMAIRARLVRTDRRLAALLAVLVLGASVVLHHGAPHGMAAMHGGDHGTSAAAMCVGTIVTGVAIVGLVLAAAVRRRRRLPRPSRSAQPLVLRLVPTVPLPRARSSPLWLRHAVVRR